MTTSSEDLPRAARRLRRPVADIVALVHRLHVAVSEAWVSSESPAPDARCKNRERMRVKAQSRDRCKGHLAPALGLGARHGDGSLLPRPSIGTVRKLGRSSQASLPRSICSRSSCCRTCSTAATIELCSIHRSVCCRGSTSSRISSVNTARVSWTRSNVLVSNSSTSSRWRPYSAFDQVAENSRCVGQVVEHNGESASQV